jgi:hypothetical protein
MMRPAWWVGLAAALAAFAVPAAPAGAQRAPLAPRPKIRAMIFSGEPLVRRVAIDDSVAVADLLASVREPMTDASRDLDYRPYIDVALFEAEPTSAAMPLEHVPLERADEHARFYAAYGDEAPFWVFLDDAHEASPVRYVLKTGLDLLQRHGVPVRARPGG